MHPKLRLFSLLIVLVCVSVALTGILMSREDYMAEIPVHRHFRCSLCHNTDEPKADDLNEFGSDFSDNAHEWNYELAVMDSDGDGYPNGVEVGDEDGDGMPEITMERSNPGDPYNFPNSISMETWSIIKSLFEED